MCGIIGYVGEKDAAPLLIEGLKRLEYRGYDSAGLAVIDGGRLEVRRRVGKIANLERALFEHPVQSRVGIGHTRWATHGQPSDANAHPHADCSRTLAVVHNGIIENHVRLRRELEHAGHVFTSSTDTEVIVHLIESFGTLPLDEATARAVGRLQGAFALAVVSAREPDVIVGARNGGPPLIVASGAGGELLASDVSALLTYTRHVQILEDGEMAVLSPERTRVRTFAGRARPPRVVHVDWNAADAEKDGYPHFMLKEIHEQPRAIGMTISPLIDAEREDGLRRDSGLDAALLARARRVLLLGCGTSWHAALAAKYMIETLARVPVEVDVASESRYRHAVIDGETLVVAISQSGETADTMGAVRAARNAGGRVLAICNVPGASLTREADAVIYTRTGPEIGVASTKAFTSQLAALAMLAIHLGRARGTLPVAAARALVQQLGEAPALVRAALDTDARVREIAQIVYECTSCLYLGRGMNMPLALEGALKLKEISYIHAEGYPAGEMKHGPIALIDGTLPVVVLAPRDELYDKLLGCIEEVKARHGVVIALTTGGDEGIAERADHLIACPAAPPMVQPMVLAVPLQLLAYHVAVLRRCDVDQPRNLAKSVTVE
jgi:glucosamine--fructose-6-phosphate aminotransferase (isomerizing)